MGQFMVICFGFSHIRKIALRQNFVLVVPEIFFTLLFDFVYVLLVLNINYDFLPSLWISG